MTAGSSSSRYRFAPSIFPTNSQEKEKRPEVKWWMIALCFLLIGIIFILNTLQRQQEYDEKHKNITNSSDNDLDTDKGQTPDQQTPNK